MRNDRPLFKAMSTRKTITPAAVETKDGLKAVDIVLEVPDEEQGGADRRIQIRLSDANYKYLEKEATKTGTTMSALASLATADWIAERKAAQRDIDEYIERQVQRAVDTSLRQMTDAAAKAARRDAGKQRTLEVKK